MVTKQLYLVIRLPESSSTSVSLLNSSSTYIPLLSNSSTLVPLLEVVVHLYHYKPRSSTGVLATIIGLAKLEYLYSWHMLQNMQIYRYTKPGRISNQRTKTNVLILKQSIALLPIIRYCKYIQNKRRIKPN